MSSITLGQSMRADRERLGITQSTLARAMEVSPQLVSRWEDGGSMPRGHRVQMLISVLGPDSQTAKLVETFNAVDPSFLSVESERPWGALPRTRAPDGMDEAGALAAVRATIARSKLHQSVRERQDNHERNMLAMMRRPEDVRVQFIQATEKLTRITSLMSRVAQLMAETGDELQAIGKRLDKMNNQNDRPEPDNPND